MQIQSNQAETDSVLATAKAMCVAARTAPKAKGTDLIDTIILTGSDLEALAVEMDRLGKEGDKPSFIRDAGNVRASQAVVLVGTKEGKRGLNAACQLCHFNDCAACTAADGVCVYDPMDLGIAIGSAVALAADHRIDNRVMFSMGMAAKSLGIMGETITMIMGIPLSASGKSVFFDR